MGTTTGNAKSAGGAAPKKVLVAIHGIGDQTRFATLQQLVHRCLAHRGLPQGVPIGKLHSRLVSTVGGAEQLEAWGQVSPLPALGFAEVHWADIAREGEEYLLEETVRWAHTIAERLAVLDLVSATPGAPPRRPIDLEAVRRTLTDVATAISVARLANRLLAKLELGSVDLDRLLVRYLGDVQLFAEFASKRARILARFEKAMEAIDARAAREAGAEEVEIHLCAHSQGSVVAFLGLLDGWKAGKPWLRRVRSLMTIGSPIDTFLLLWPELWTPYGQVPPRGGGTPIRWLNYADRGDPIGYELHAAAEFVRYLAPGLFAAGDPDDRIYSRYVVPGKAHVDYWNDDAPFREWLATAVGIQPADGGPSGPPADRLARRILSTLLLFLLPAILAWLAAHSLGAAVDGILGERALFSLGRVAATAFLLLGAIALGGASRVSRRPFWLALGAGLFAAGAGCFLLAFPYAAAASLATILLLAAVGQNLLDRRVPS